MPGPAPKPLALRVLHGDTKHPRHNHTEPQPRVLFDTTPPEWFDAPARAVWEEVIEDLDRMGLLKQCDLFVVATFVQAFRTFEEAGKVVTQYGVLVPSAKGKQPIRNPAVAVQRDALNLVRLIGRELGMSPAARTMMATKPDNNDAADVAARYLTGS